MLIVFFNAHQVRIHGGEKMKVVVVGDALVISKTLTDAVQQMNLGDNIEIEQFEWNSNLEKHQFQEKILLIEQEGSEAVEIPDGIIEALTDADYLFVHLAPVSKSMLESARKLKLIGTCRGGLEHIHLEALRIRNIPLFHVIRNAEPVADFTVGLMYAETRNIARAHQAIMNGKWQKSFPNDYFKTTLISLTVGLIGLGHIGKRVAKRLTALGVKVIAYDPFIKAEQIMQYGLEVEMKDLHEVFRTANIISLHMRVTPETTNMVNKSLISLMRPDSYLINTARASLLCKDDLIEALQNKQIAGAALDVSWIEPIPDGDPLLNLDNITLTSHIAGDTIDAIPRAPYLLKDVINDFLKKGHSDMQIQL